MRLLRTIATLTLLLAEAALWPAGASAQEINFDQINKFESLGTGTLHVGAPPKAIIDESERHVVILTIWDADAETKVYWRSPDGNDSRTTIIPGKGIQTFQTAGEFKLEAIGEPDREVNYGYVLLGLRSRGGTLKSRCPSSGRYLTLIRHQPMSARMSAFGGTP
jgi:hypothetical protein